MKTKGITGLYSGCTALIVGNSVKAGVRFVSYGKFKGMLADAEVRLWSLHLVTSADMFHREKLALRVVSSVRTCCGIPRIDRSYYGTRSWAGSWDDRGGVCGYAFRNNQVRLLVNFHRPEANHFLYRTKLIDDAKRPVPQYRGLIHGTTEIVKAEGLRGIYRGLFPVVRTSE